MAINKKEKNMLHFLHKENVECKWTNGHIEEVY